MASIRKSDKIRARLYAHMLRLYFVLRVYSYQVRILVGVYWVENVSDA
jgi:hypothetical protein